MDSSDLNAYAVLRKPIRARRQKVRRRGHMRHGARAEEDVVDAVEDRAVAGLAEYHFSHPMLHVYPVS